jgi:hypothetical protein
MLRFDDEVEAILGRPNFACIAIAKSLRLKGHKIKEKAEAEQSAVLYWMLTLYEEHGKNWKEKGDDYLKEESND